MKKQLTYGALLLIVFVFSLLLILPGGSRYSKSDAVLSNVKFPYMAGGELFYFSEYAVTKFNTSTGKMEDLTNLYLFPDILEVKWSKKGVLFRATNYRPVDSFMSTLDKRGLNRDQSYWWLADFGSKKISLITNPIRPSEYASMAWAPDGNSFFIMADDPSEEINRVRIYEHNLNNATEIMTVKSSQKMRDLRYGDSSRVIAEATDGGSISLVLIELRNGEVKTLQEGIQPGSAVKNDGSLIAFMKLRGSKEETLVPPKDLYLLDVSTLKAKKLAKELDPVAQWDNETQMLVYSGTKKGKPITRAYDPATGKKYSFEPKTDSDYIEPSFLKLMSVTQPRIFATDLKYNLYELADKPRRYETNRSKSFDGFSYLVDNAGITAFQVETLQFLVDRLHNNLVGTVTLNEESVRMLDKAMVDNRIINSISFKYSVGDNTYEAMMSFEGIGRTRLVVSDSGKQIYDSGEVDFTSRTVDE